MSVSAPTLPANISIISRICDEVDNAVVMPTVRPAVPRAEPVSNRQEVRGRSSIMLMAMPVVIKRVIYA